MSERGPERVGATALEDRLVPAAEFEMGPVRAVRDPGGHVFEGLDPVPLMFRVRVT